MHVCWGVQCYLKVAKGNDTFLTLIILITKAADAVESVDALCEKTTVLKLKNQKNFRE